MAIYTTSKGEISAPYPDGAIQTELDRLEPILGYNELRDRHLFGIPLVSQMKDPATGKPIAMSPEMVKDIIDGALNQAEVDCRINISPVKLRQKQPFDRNAYESFGYVRLPNRPITSLDKLSVTPANQQDIYVVPVEWIEMAYASQGQINIIPMTASFIQGGYIPTGTTGGQFFLSVMGNRQWIPAYWQFEYTAGYKDSMIPRIVNDLIGTIAAQEILSMLAATYARSQSHSLGIDGLSQSVSTPGPQIFKNRWEELEAKRLRLIKRIRNLYGTGVMSSHV
jgi:hypothetical protein